jgi:hypothetical protein
VLVLEAAVEDEDLLAIGVSMAGGGVAGAPAGQSHPLAFRCMEHDLELVSTRREHATGDRALHAQPMKIALGDLPQLDEQRAALG